jgi:hypothetical protein
VSYYPVRKRLFTPAIIETNQSSDLRAHSELAGTSDGSRWVEVGTDALPVGAYEHSSLVYACKMWRIGGFPAISSVYHSTDGIAWTLVGNLPVDRYRHSSVIYNGKMWVIGGISTGAYTKKILYSIDGITWTEAGINALPASVQWHSSVVFNGKMWIIGGTDGGLGISGRVFYSTDGITWTLSAGALPVATTYHSSLVFNSKMWVIGGDTGAVTANIYYSTDGITWTLSAGTLPISIRSHTSLVYNGKMWVIGGFDGVSRLRTVYYSTDGITWTQAGVDALPVATYVHSSVVYNGKMWVIGGNTGAAARKVYSTVPQTSGLVVDGPRYLKRTPTAASYAALRSDHYIGVTSTAALRTITLPAVADAYSGKEYIISDESGLCSVNNITIQCAGAELIDGSNTYVMSSNWQSVTIVCNTLGWSIV